MNALDFQKYKIEKRKITMVTSYDFWSAKIIEKSPVDCALVGDSVSMVVHGYPSTVHATIEMMALHTRAVAKGLKEKFLVSDLPFLSYRKGVSETLQAVDELMKAGAQAVKLEGVWGHEEAIKAIVQSGVPVMAHIGLTPQSVNGLGGFKVQGRDEKTAKDLIQQASVLEDLGCFSVVLECIPQWISETITQKLSIPTIGIGAGSQTDGQVLVLQDLLGMNQTFKPKFLRHFLNGETHLGEALVDYHQAVLTGEFPNEAESYT